MKHCPKCGKEYPDSNSMCFDGANLLPGANRPWRQHSTDSSPTSTTSGQNIYGDEISLSRRFPYVILAGIFVLVTIVSFSYPYLRDSAYQAFSGLNLRRNYVANSTAKSDVMSALNGWAAATNARDLNAHMSYYADNLSVYYNHTNVSKDFVRSSRAPAFTKYSTLNVQLNNVQVSIDSSESTSSATFTKTWDFNGKRRSTGSTQQRILLTKVGGRWVITGEEDQKINYANW